nr:MAG TPA: hypothetical protein [Caudoviricetes sp.]
MENVGSYKTRTAVRTGRLFAAQSAQTLAH